MLPDRFWAHVVLPTVEGSCWLWVAGLSDGYGRVRMGGRMQFAHRLVLEEKLGRRLLPGMDTCHSCDVRACVNPDHLWEGTRAQNVADMTAKGRHGRTGARGGRHGMAKLTDAQAIQILRDTRNNTVIARVYGVSRTAISVLRSGQAWKHLPREVRT